MKTRPWPLVVLAIIQVWSPVVSVLLSAWAYQIAPSQVVYWLFQRPGIEIFEFFALMPIAGYAIYQMKRWSYVVFFIAMVWSFWTRLRHWDLEYSSVSTWVILLTYVFEAGLVVYFLLPSVRATYLDPGVRWWEQMSRYRVDADGTVQVGDHSYRCRVVDVSAGGALLQLSEDFPAELASNLTSGSELVFTLPLLSKLYSASAKILRVHGPSADASGSPLYGIRFKHNEKSAGDFMLLSNGLRELGYPDRLDRKPFFKGLKEWAIMVLKTGKGLVPEIRRRNR